MTGLRIGDKTWFKGDEVTIISKPYQLHGSTFQDAKTEGGKVVTVLTKEQREANAKAAQDAWKVQQAGFRRLSK